MVPVASYLGRDKRLLLATVPFAVAAIWGLYHLMTVAVAFTGRGNPFALTWAVAFALLWWVPLAWLEKPYEVTPDQHAELMRHSLTVSIPVYNEPAERLLDCLRSLLAQTILPSRIRVVDDGTTEHDYTHVRVWLEGNAFPLGVEVSWERQENRGKRHAQMAALAPHVDDADIYMTLDSDTILDRRAIEEGVKPFADPEVMSVAGMVAVWNSHGNWLARLTCMLYTPFTRGFRSAQSVLGQVMVNSGTLAWYRGDVIRRFAGIYERETFLGRPMQMNDDSMMTLYGLVHGKAVHQPTAVAYTIVPERFDEYRRQQMRWMRGTFVRTWWWFRYMPINSAAFWMPMLELAQLALSILMWPAFLLKAHELGDLRQFAILGILVSCLLNYVMGLRYFIIQRSDESVRFQIGIFLLAPLAGLWRALVLRPLMIYCYATFWKIGKWGTRAKGDAAADGVMPELMEMARRRGRHVARA